MRRISIPASCEEEAIAALPERNLLLAVLNLAVRDLFGNDIAERADAVRWFKNEEVNGSAPRIPFSLIVDVFNFSDRRQNTLLRYVADTEAYDRGAYSRQVKRVKARHRVVK